MKEVYGHTHTLLPPFSSLWLYVRECKQIHNDQRMVHHAMQEWWSFTTLNWRAGPSG